MTSPPSAVSASTAASLHFTKPEAWTSVSSSNVDAVAYLPDPAGMGGLLRVRFRDRKSGRTSEYEYTGVPNGAYLSMLAAASKGKFMWAAIRGRYNYRRIR